MFVEIQYVKNIDMSVEGTYCKRPALCCRHIWLQPHLYPSAPQNGHDPTIFLSLSTLSVGGKGLLATAGGEGSKKTTAKKHVDLFQYILSTLLRGANIYEQIINQSYVFKPLSEYYSFLPYTNKDIEEINSHGKLMYNVYIQYLKY